MVRNMKDRRKLINTDGILWRGTGFRLELEAIGPQHPLDNPKDLYLLHIGDLNPEQEIRQGVTRLEAARIGFWFLCRAVFPTRRPEVGG